MMLFNPIPRQKPYCTISDFIIFIKMFLRKQLIEGSSINEFECLFSKKYGVAHSLALGSCRSGFALIIDALGIKSGDEVILPAFNLSAFPKILKLKGIKPIFNDIDEKTFNIDANKIEANITPKTKAIVAVHLFGNVCDMDRIMHIARKHDLCVIEDCANAFMTQFKNSNVGTYGNAACFSLGHSKDVPTFGGGVVITNNNSLNLSMRERYDKEYLFPGVGDMIRVFIKNILLKVATSKFVFLLFIYPFVLLFSLFGFDIIGHVIEEDDQMITKISKKRFTNFQAHIGIDKLNENNRMQAKRVEIAQAFNKALSSLDNVTAAKVIEGGSHAYWNYPMLFDRRLFLANQLLWHGIDAREVTTYNCNRYKIFEEFKQECPATDKISKTILTLPIYHALTEKEVHTINKVMKDTVNKLA